MIGAAAVSPVASREEARRTRRFVALDAWRGAAALAVVYGHVTAGRLGAGEWFLAFYLAVDFFFVPSGFLLARRYWDDLTRGSRFTPVVVARFARLYPAHACVLLALLLALAVEAIPAMLAGAPVLSAWREAIPPFAGGSGLYTFVFNALLLHSVGFTPKGLSWNVPSWSISVDFFGSLAVLLLIARWRWTAIRVVLAAIAAGGYALVFALKGQLDAIFGAALTVVYLGLVRRIAGVALWRAVPAALPQALGATVGGRRDHDRARAGSNRRHAGHHNPPGMPQRTQPILSTRRGDADRGLRRRRGTHVAPSAALLHHTVEVPARHVLMRRATYPAAHR